MGLIYDSKSGYITALMQMKAKQVRSTSLSPANFYDTILLQLTTGGSPVFAV